MTLSQSRILMELCRSVSCSRDLTSLYCLSGNLYKCHFYHYINLKVIRIWGIFCPRKIPVYLGPFYRNSMACCTGESLLSIIASIKKLLEFVALFASQIPLCPGPFSRNTMSCCTGGKSHFYHCIQLHQ